MTATVRVWCIGADRTEMYAAHSEEELRTMYVEMVGEDQTVEDFAEYCEELSPEEMDAEIDFNDDGKIIKTTWRKVAEGGRVPAQISTSYN